LNRRTSAPLRRGSLARGALLAALAALAAAPAAAQYFGQNKVQYRQYDWRTLRSDHFEIFFYPELDSLARRVLDLSEKSDALLSRTLGHRLTRRVPIVLYGSHNDFAQTNVTPALIDAGTGGFTEVLRNRVVLPFTGPYEDLRHVLVHELVHAYMFDLLYGGAAGAMLARQSFYQPPLWFAEGLAEYVSLGMEPNAEMFLRDGTIDGYLPPLMASGGYIVYKQGQSAVSYLVERFGEERLRELLQRMRQMRSFERAFQRTLGSSVERFDQQWRDWLRKRYWPLVASREDPERFARRLTHHRSDASHFNTAPAISPRGDRVAYISDRRQYTDVYVMSAFDGKVLRRLIRGERTLQFEAIPSFRAALTWSPDGERLALVAKSGGRDLLYVVSAHDGRVLRRLDLGCPALSHPAWSPVSDSVVVAGVRGDRSDLWLVDVRTGEITRLTDDTFDEVEVCWRPDGRSITFASDRIAPVVLHPQRRQRGYGAYGLYGLDLESRRVEPVFDTPGDDRWPAWSRDGTRLAFISDRGGAPNIHLYDPADGTVTQLTDVRGGITSLSWSRESDRLVFAAFDRGGVDVFAVREALSGEGVLERLRRQAPHAVEPVALMGEAPWEPPDSPPARGALALAWPDSLTGPADTTGRALADGVARDAPATAVARPALDPARSSWDPRAFEPAWADSAPPPLPSPTPLLERGGPFALPDSVLSQKPARYRGRLAPDYVGAGFYASTLGAVGAAQFVFSDFLGNHNLFVATDVFSDNLAETNALVVYNYLPRRWDVGGGLFHFKNYYWSEVTSLGEGLGTPRLFAERNFGLLLSTSYPFDRFRRAELGFMQMFVERTFFAEDDLGFFETGKEYRSVSSPSLSLVGDNALFGFYGPVNGQRYNLSLTPSFAWFHNGLAYRTATADVRRYWDLSNGHTFAGRLLGGVSGGRDPQIFQVGGFSTVRGFPDFETTGSRIAIANAELRFPFIQQLGVVGPVPLGVFNLRGATFLDLGLVWNRGESPRVSRVVGGRRRLQDLMLGFGVGARTAFAFLLLKLDLAWRSDLDGVSQPRWHFSIGPEF
jgi:Tol biopolymer transport system component